MIKSKKRKKKVLSVVILFVSNLVEVSHGVFFSLKGVIEKRFWKPWTRL